MDCRMLDSVGAYATRMMGRIAALFCRVPRYTPLYVSVSLRFPCPEDRLSSYAGFVGLLRTVIAVLVTGMMIAVPGSLLAV